MRWFLLVLLITIVFTACANNVPTETPATPTAVPTKVATPTPVKPLVILILPADMPAEEADVYQTLVYNLAQQHSLRFQVRNTLTIEELKAELPALKIVIALPPDPGLADLTAAAPEVQFLAVKIPGLTAGGNLSTIGGSDQAIDKQAFLAGYIAAMIAPEWRTGVLSQRDTPGGEAARWAFVYGHRYFCGYCRSPNFTQPAYEYPIVVRIPTDAKPGEYLGYAAALLDYLVRAAYLYPDVATPEIATYLAQYRVMLIGQELPTEEVRANWVVSIQPNVLPAIEQIFPELLEGKGGQAVPTPLYLTDVNPDLLSEGKLRMAQEVLEGLQKGIIWTGVNP
ncbi:MAG: hypothetical protein RMJ60_09665 [Anaerolineales bacterium]|nr:hypothetical protein [Anaerolineales bacterium]